MLLDSIMSKHDLLNNPETSRSNKTKSTLPLSSTTRILILNMYQTVVCINNKHKDMFSF